jgi:hypothetical protein
MNNDTGNYSEGTKVFIKLLSGEVECRIGHGAIEAGHFLMLIIWSYVP